jgi:cobalt-zinc-cadmium efflux system protein
MSARHSAHRHSHEPHAHAPGAHDHDHAHLHRPPPATPSAQRALMWALVLTAGFAIVEAAGGWWSGSLALLSDAGHMLTDAAALGLALFAQRIAARPPSRRASYGYARAEVIAAFVNALALLALVVFIVVEAVRRLLAPAPVAGAIVLGIALVGAAVNVLTAWILSRATRTLNTRGALLHVLSDLLGSAAAIVAGAVIVITGWTPIDPILSIAVSLLILRSTWRLLADSTGVLMERVPSHLDYDDIGRALLEVPGITGVHDLHVWQMSADRIALSAHVALADSSDWLAILGGARRLLAERYAIEHTTLQPSWPMPPRFGDGRRVIPISGRPDR